MKAKVIGIFRPYLSIEGQSSTRFMHLFFHEYLPIERFWDSEAKSCKFRLLDFENALPLIYSNFWSKIFGIFDKNFKQFKLRKSSNIAIERA